MTTGEQGTPRASAASAASATSAAGAAGVAGQAPPAALSVFSWLWVGVPMAYGLYELILKAVQLFTGG